MHTKVEIHRQLYGYVSISCADAAKIQIFNPELVTHRRVMLEKLVNAKVFRTRWPDRLRMEVQRLVGRGLSDREIADTILDQYNVYVRMRTIKEKRNGMTSIP